MMQKLYFAHPINTYDTEMEERLLVKINEAFPGWEIENPNQENHRLGYKEWKKEKGNGMEYYFQEVLPFCAGGVFLRFRDGAWGAGVCAEAKFFADRNLPIWIVSPNGKVRRGNLKKAKVLSVEETVARIRNMEGNSKPY